MSTLPRFVCSTRSLMDIAGLIHWLEYIWALDSCLFLISPFDSLSLFFSRALEFLILMLDFEGIAD